MAADMTISIQVRDPAGQWRTVADTPDRREVVRLVAHWRGRGYFVRYILAGNTQGEATR
jgi:hypothetical protein